MKAWQDLELDCIFLWEAEEGFGKSVGNYWSLRTIAELNGHDLDIKKAMIWTEDELYEVLSDYPERSEIWIDEAAEIFYNRTSQTTERARLNTKLTTVRERKFALGMCCPRVGMLDEYLREHRFRTRIEVDWRGLAEVFFRDRRVKVGDPWYLKDRKLRYKHYKNKKGGSFWGRIKYPDMPDDDKAIYLKLKRKNMEKKDVSNIGMLKGELGVTLGLRKILEFDMITLQGHINKLKEEKRREPFTFEWFSEITGVSDTTIREQVLKVKEIEYYNEMKKRQIEKILTENEHLQ